MIKRISPIYNYIAAIKRGSSSSWSSYWSALTNLLLFFGQIKNISEGKLYNEMLGASDYFTVGGSAESYTFQCPDNATYIAADTDYIWFKTDGTQRTTTEAELIGYDLQRTPVKYDDDSPYSIRWIAILKLASSPPTSEMNKIRDSFQLSVWWSNILSSHGNVKGNRGVGQSIWTSEPVLNDPTGLTLTLISGGVKIDWTDTNGGTAETEIWAKNDGEVSALIYTITAGTVTKNDTCNPVDLRYYKIRAKSGSDYSDYSAEQSIAMLGAEMISDPTMSTGWTSAGYWTITGGKAVYDGAGTGHIDTNLLVLITKHYRVRFTVSDRSGVLKIALWDDGGWVIFSAPFNTYGYIDLPDGIYTGYLTCSRSSNAKIYLYGAFPETFKIDDFSVKEILVP